ncbi:hypothetical protein EON64_00500 [archaeon]|nr:MAG: hypothetical protein EON64_00500 [archaeon]
MSDKRIHLVISVSAPAAPHMLMVECWRKLHRLASIVPVIMKADTLTPEELVKLRDNYRGVIRDLSSGADQGIMFSFEDVPQPVDNGVGTETSGIMETEQTDDTQSETTDQHFHDGCINVLTSSLTPFSESSEMVQSAVMVSSQVSPAPESPQVGDYPISMEEIAYPSGLVMESTISADSFDMHPNTVGSTATYLNTMESTSPATADIFAVVCTLQQSHKRVYAWAAVDSFDENVSDFRKLLRLIFESGKLALLRSRCQEMSMRLLSSLPNKEEPISARVGGGRMIGYVSRWKNHLCNFFVLTFLAGTSAYLMKSMYVYSV